MMPILPKYFFKGQITEDSTFAIPANSRALRYGDGLFETILYALGRPVALEHHLERMFEGMEIIQLDFERDILEEELKAAIDQLTENQNIDFRARIRISVFRTGGGAYLPESNRPEFWIEMQPFTYNSAKNLCTIGFAKEFPLVFSALSKVKSMNALPYILAAKHAQNNAWDDAILCNADGQIAECTSSNIFLVKDQQLFSPPLSSGCLPGTMRERVLEAAQKLGLSVQENALDEGDLEGADEIFLTNAIQGIRNVGKIAGLQYSGKHFPISNQIRTEFPEWP